VCQKVNLPTHCVAILNAHKDEVWLVKFSSSGNLVGSVGKDNLLVIWRIEKGQKGDL